MVGGCRGRVACGTVLNDGRILTVLCSRRVVWTGIKLAGIVSVTNGELMNWLNWLVLLCGNRHCRGMQQVTEVRICC